MARSHVFLYRDGFHKGYDVYKAWATRLQLDRCTTEAVDPAGIERSRTSAREVGSKL